MVHEHTHYLSMVVADDTGSIRCTIPPFDMDELKGFEIAADILVGQDVAIYGMYQSKFNNVSIKTIQLHGDLQ